MNISEPVVILGGGTAVLAILFSARLTIRAMAGCATTPRTAGETSTIGGSAAPDVAGVIALPPLIFLAFLVATVLEMVVPLPVLAADALARYLGGAALAVCGLVLIAMGTSRFVAAGTNIPPNLPTTALVVDGIYGRTRNPLCLGTTLIYLGLSVAAGSLWAIVLVVPVGNQCGRDCAGGAPSGA
jgi:protein-S-isoprenylcysteine O-methyltransferase Ste14